MSADRPDLGMLALRLARAMVSAEEPILEALEGRGLLDRTPHPGDRRRQVVTLTDAGRELVGRCRSGIRAMEARLLADVDPADADAFVRVLREIAP